MSTKRTRNFGTIVYPESAPDDWQDILMSFRVPCFISPIHDSDINPDGHLKKAHYHVMIMFDSVKTIEQADLIINAIGGVGHEIVQSQRGYARYLCHLDNPEKHQYCIDDVRSVFGADYNHVIGLAHDKYKVIREIILFCNDNGIYRYDKLLEYSIQENESWYRVLCDNGTYVVKEYLKSKYWAIKQHDV